jgi:hypothetical protein
MLQVSNSHGTSMTNTDVLDTGTLDIGTVRANRRNSEDENLPQS